MWNYRGWRLLEYPNVEKKIIASVAQEATRAAIGKCCKRQYSDTMPAIITDSFDYDDIVRVLDLDEAFVQHQVDARTLNELIRIPYQFIAMQYGQNSYISILR